MATSKPIELRYYPQIEEDTIVFSSIWGLVASGTTDPITNNPVEARFDVISDGKARLSLTLDNGLAWNGDTKQLTINVHNSDLSFVKATGTMAYAFYVTWDYGQTQTIKEGTVNAVRVA